MSQVVATLALHAIDLNADLYFMPTRPIVTTAAFEINLLNFSVHVAGLFRLEHEQGCDDFTLHASLTPF